MKSEIGLREGFREKERAGTGLGEKVADLAGGERAADVEIHGWRWRK